MTETALRNLPSIDQLLHRTGIRALIADAGRDAVRDRLREVIAGLRTEIIEAEGESRFPTDSDSLAAEIERRAHACFEQRTKMLTQRVINASGVILHTNLGRAPLSRRAIDAIARVAGGYCNLEFDLTSGGRGMRGAAIESMLRDLTGCEAAVVVNNCAAAVLITLNTLAEGGEVIISRGELIEIGGSFRIPDVIAKSGAYIREVGTTNRTHLGDYEKAINERTRVILRAHPSNYRIVGFTEKPSLTELAQLARAHNLPLFEDLGSGCMVDLSPLGINDEPTVAASIKAGCSVVAFSGDKLMGGPQSGIILGEKEIIDRIRTNPLMRALRVDKLTYAALEATVNTYLCGRAVDEIPAIGALHATNDTLTCRALSFISRAMIEAGGLHLELIDGHSVVGGGSAPTGQLSTTLIVVKVEGLNAVEIEANLRTGDPPVIARIIDDRLVIDLRTVDPDEENELIAALGKSKKALSPEC